MRHWKYLHTILLYFILKSPKLVPFAFENQFAASVVFGFKKQIIHPFGIIDRAGRSETFAINASSQLEFNRLSRIQFTDLTEYIDSLLPYAECFQSLAIVGMQR